MSRGLFWFSASPSCSLFGSDCARIQRLLDRESKRIEGLQAELETARGELGETFRRHSSVSRLSTTSPQSGGGKSSSRSSRPSSCK
eukprot:m.24892 g.24892  ORF g.24892 m.24892 type:complete len:86 (-) comp4358_c0_seq2:7-264(-)